MPGQRIPDIAEGVYHGECRHHHRLLPEQPLQHRAHQRRQAVPQPTGGDQRTEIEDSGVGFAELESEQQEEEAVEETCPGGGESRQTQRPRGAGANGHILLVPLGPGIGEPYAVGGGHREEPRGERQGHSRIDLLGGRAQGQDNGSGKNPDPSQEGICRHQRHRLGKRHGEHARLGDAVQPGEHQHGKGEGV